MRYTCTNNYTAKPNDSRTTQWLIRNTNHWTICTNSPPPTATVNTSDRRSKRIRASFFNFKTTVAGAGVISGTTALGAAILNYNVLETVRAASLGAAAVGGVCFLLAVVMHFSSDYIAVNDPFKNEWEVATDDKIHQRNKRFAVTQFLATVFAAPFAGAYLLSTRFGESTSSLQSLAANCVGLAVIAVAVALFDLADTAKRDMTLTGPPPNTTYTFTSK